MFKKTRLIPAHHRKMAILRKLEVAEIVFDTTPENRQMLYFT
jgi:hypothetical protein